MGYGIGNIFTTKRPRKSPGGKKKINRSAHARGRQAVRTHTRRLSNGRVIQVRSHGRGATFVSQHEKAGKGYGLRERRISGKVDYRRKTKRAHPTKSHKGSTRKTHIHSK